MKIDMHAHYLPPAYLEFLKKNNISKPDGFPLPEWSEEGQLTLMEQLDISYACLSISSPHIHTGDGEAAAELARACNEYGVLYAKKNPGRIGIFASLPLPDVEQSLNEIQWCDTQTEVIGYSILSNSNGVYLGHSSTEPVLEKLNSQNAIVAIHPTAPTALPQEVNELLPIPFMEFFFDTTRAVYNLLLSGLIGKYSNIKWIVPHAGAVIAPISDRIQSLPAVLNQSDFKLDVFGDLSSLYYDLCGTAMPKQYDLLRTIAREDHLLYGTDFPFTPLPVAQRMLHAMEEKIDTSLKDGIYFKNAEALLKK